MFFYAARFNYNNGNVGGSLPLSVNLLLEHRTKPLPLFGIGGGGGMNNCFTCMGFHSGVHSAAGEYLQDIV